MTSDFRIVGNWKMNGSLSLLERFAKEDFGCDFDLLLPAPYLYPAMRLFEDKGVRVGAQSLSPFSHGAYTSQISAAMLSDLGVSLAMVGHSEVRKLGNAQWREQLLQHRHFSRDWSMLDEGSGTGACLPTIQS